MPIPIRQFWHRVAGSRTYHATDSRWYETGKAICGRIVRAYVYRSGDPAKWEGAEHEMLATYPRSYGKVSACKHCMRKVEVK